MSKSIIGPGVHQEIFWKDVFCPKKECFGLRVSFGFESLLQASVPVAMIFPCFTKGKVRPNQHDWWSAQVTIVKCVFIFKNKQQKEFVWHVSTSLVYQKIKMKNPAIFCSSESNDDLLWLIFPELCAVCGKSLAKNERCICTPLSFPSSPEPDFIWCQTILLLNISGESKIEAASGYYYFSKGERVQQLIHQLKYKGRKDVGLFYRRIVWLWFAPIHLLIQMRKLWCLFLCTLQNSKSAATTKSDFFLPKE